MIIILIIIIIHGLHNTFLNRDELPCENGSLKNIKRTSSETKEMENTDIYLFTCICMYACTYLYFLTLCLTLRWYALLRLRYYAASEEWTSMLPHKKTHGVWCGDHGGHSTRCWSFSFGHLSIPMSTYCLRRDEVHRENRPLKNKQQRHPNQRKWKTLHS